MRGYRHSLDKLRDVNVDLANEFDRVSRELEHHPISSDVDSAPPGLYDQQTRTHRLLSEKWDAVVGRIRQIDGFTSYRPYHSPISNLLPQKVLSSLSISANIVPTP
jgi:hypothetical protein